MYEMLTRKELSQKRNRIRNRTIKKNLKKDIYRLHNEAIKDTRKRQHFNN